MEISHLESFYPGGAWYEWWGKFDPKYFSFGIRGHANGEEGVRATGAGEEVPFVPAKDLHNLKSGPRLFVKESLCISSWKYRFLSSLSLIAIRSFICFTSFAGAWDDSSIVS